MALHQYIGARYVPYFYQNSLDPTSTEWEPNVTYEALTVVTLPNDHTYISKKEVPDTIGSPALNAEYWLDQGSYNAYIQNLQNQIDIIDADVSQLQTDVSALKNIGKMWYIGDSFLELSPHNWGTYLDGFLNKNDSYYTCEGGIGVVRPGNITGYYMAQLINNDPNVPDDIDIAVVVIGCNDTRQEFIADFPTNMGLLINAIKTKAPHVRKIYFTYNGTYQGPAYSDYNNRYPYVGGLYHMMANYCVGDEKCVFVRSAACQLQTSLLLDAGAVHPTDLGSTFLAKSLFNTIMGGGDSTVIFTRKVGGVVFNVGGLDNVTAWVDISQTWSALSPTITAFVYTPLATGVTLPYYPRNYCMRMNLYRAEVTDGGVQKTFNGHILVRPSGEISLYSDTSFSSVTAIKAVGGSTVVTMPLFMEQYS